MSIFIFPLHLLVQAQAQRQHQHQHQVLDLHLGLDLHLVSLPDSMAPAWFTEFCTPSDDCARPENNAKSIIIVRMYFTITVSKLLFQQVWTLYPLFHFRTRFACKDILMVPPNRSTSLEECPLETVYRTQPMCVTRPHQTTAC